MSKVIRYELVKAGYIMEDGKEIDPVIIKTGKTKEELLSYAKKKKLDVYSYFVDTIGEEIICGTPRPITLNDHPEFLNNII